MIFVMFCVGCDGSRLEGRGGGGVPSTCQPTGCCFDVICMTLGEGRGVVLVGGGARAPYWGVGGETSRLSYVAVALRSWWLMYNFYTGAIDWLDGMSCAQLTTLQPRPPVHLQTSVDIEQPISDTLSTCKWTEKSAMCNYFAAMTSLYITLSELAYS